MDTPRIFVTCRLPDAVEQRLAGMGARLRRDDRPLTQAELAQAIAAHDIILPTITDRIDAGLLAAPGALQMIANFGAGVEHIDLGAARAAGIAVTNTPDALTDATADLALMLMLMAARGASAGERRLRAGSWTGWAPTDQLGQGLTGKVLGCVGFGRIGQALAVRARALGMDIAYFSRSTVSGALPARRCDSLEELAVSADVLSLHVPGGAATRHLVDAGLLAAMKPSAILINTARGSVVDEAALAAALREGRIAAAGLDVYEGEPAIHPELLACENAVLLPHLGSATVETRTAMGMQAVDNIAAFLAGGDLPNRVD